MSEKQLNARMRDVYYGADPLDHRVIIERDVLLGWIHEVDELSQSLKSIAEYDATGSDSYVKAFKKCKEIARKSSTVIN